MCDVCLHNPCVPQCPNYQPKKIGICKRCGYILYDTDEIWIDDEDQIFCSEYCAERYHGIHQLDDIEMCDIE